jgi:hypothetical protein
MEALKYCKLILSFGSIGIMQLNYMPARKVHSSIRQRHILAPGGGETAGNGAVSRDIEVSQPPHPYVYEGESNDDGRTDTGCRRYQDPFR